MHPKDLCMYEIEGAAKYEENGKLLKVLLKF